MEDTVIAIFSVVFPLLIVMVIVWFIQVSRLFARLREHHPQEYEAMGRPTLFANNTPQTNFSLLKFFMGNRARELGDVVLVRQCAFLKKFFYVYLSLFLGLMSLMVAMAVSGS